jgi:DNA mismatch endonuclease (patch repair protein)
VVRRLLHALGFSFRRHRGDLPGKPDIVLSRHCTIIFVHGCFRHGHLGCPHAQHSASNTEFWNAPGLLNLDDGSFGRAIIDE